jgi:DNA recombination protein RmuC
MTADTLLWAVLALSALAVLLALVLVLRKPAGPTAEDWLAAQQAQALAQTQAQTQVQLHAQILAQSMAQVQDRIDRLERELRHEVQEGSRGGRQEVMQTLTTVGDTLTKQAAEGQRTQQAQLEQLRTSVSDTLTAQLQAQTQQAAEATRTQNAQLDAFAQQLLQLRGTLADTLTQQFQAIAASLGQQASEVQRTQHAQIELLRTSVSDTLNAQLHTQTQQAAESTRTQNAQLDAFAQQLQHMRHSLSDTLVQQLQGMSSSNTAHLAAVRDTLESQQTQSRQAIEQLQLQVRQTLEQQIQSLQAENAKKLDEMRATVDEKLQTTLETRLGESFKQVADRLEQVHKGLGEMQTLAQGVGDLKHLLTNVKTRGMFGEAQLASLLEQVMAPEQYATQVATRPGSKNVVDFAIRLPGRGDDGAPCWLPIDAKFPNEDYERLLDAQQRADATGAEEAGKKLELRIRLEAKSMADKYLEPPHTTDFAILFLPTEGLYAEVLRRPGLMEVLQRDHRVTLAGPTTLLAMLNSLQMGFRTLALEKRSSEVWQVLGAVKTEFGKFGDVLAKVRDHTQTVLNTLDKAQTRSNVMNRALRSVEALPQEQVAALLPADAGDVVGLALTDGEG